MKTLQGSPRGGLLGLLLASARADAELVSRDGSSDLEAAVVRWTLLARDLVVDGVAIAREALLELRLEVHALAGRLLDLLAEGLDHRLRGALVPVGLVAGADHRLADRGQGALGSEQGVDGDAVPLVRDLFGEELRKAHLASDFGAGAPADRLVEDLGELTDVGVRMPLEEERGHREAEDAVSEEREPPVGVRSLVDPG